MNNLWTFGDSFTQGDGCEKWDDYYKLTYNPTETYEQLIWPNHLSNHLKMKLNNISMGGGSNSYILRNIISNISKIKSGDVIAIGYTDPWRFEVPGAGNFMRQVLSESAIRGHDTFTEERWVGIDQNKRMNDSMYYYCTEIHMMKLFRDPENPNMKETWGYDVLAREVNTQFISLIKHFKNNNIKVVTFKWDDNRFSERYETIDKATNGNIKNYHLSWKGHYNLSNDLMNCLDNDISQLI